jgi:glycosyltransferase involved in cell wall biosynthesis
MKITLIASDESTAPLYRVRLLARLLARRFEVEVLGYHFDAQTLDPRAPRDFPYQGMPARPLPAFLADARKLASMATGDVIYAMKPRPTSFGTALAIARRRNLPLVVDIDDLESAMIAPYSRHALKNAAYALPHLRHPNNYLLTAAFDRMTRLADGATTVSRYFRDRYAARGRTARGRPRLERPPVVLAPQYVDTAHFDPTRFDRDAIRHLLGIERFTVVFAGIAQPNKGVGEIIQALRRLPGRSWQLLIVGPVTPYAVELAASDLRVRLLGTHPPDEMPRFLAVADAVVLPQRPEPASLGQMPMKLFEAMAMACPVISTRLADIPEVLDGCGKVVAPGDPQALAEALSDLMGDPREARRLGLAARRKVLAAYSYEHGAKRIGDLMLHVAGRLPAGAWEDDGDDPDEGSGHADG